MHRHWEDLIPFYVAKTLSPKEMIVLESHLADCIECRQLVEEWSSIAAIVWQTSSEEARGLPPLSRHIVEAVQSTSQPASVPAPPRRRIIALPPRDQAVNARPSRLGGNIQIPLTLVAAVTVVFIVVGLLLYMSLPYDENDDLGENDGTGVAALSASGERVETITPSGDTVSSVTPSPTQVITPFVASTPLSPDVFAEPTPNTGIGGGEDDIAQLSQQSFSTQMDVQTSACYAVNNQREIVNIYTFPGIQYDLVDVLNPGERIEVFTSSDNGWYQTLRIMQPRAITGWIDGGLISLEGICDNLPLPTPTQSGTNVSISQQCLVSSASTATGVDMYAGPGADYEIINTIRPQVTAAVQAESDNGWFQVRYTALSRNWVGWVNTDAVLQYFNCDNLPIISSVGYIPESTPVLAPTATIPAIITQPSVSSEVVYFTVFPITASLGDNLTLRWETRNAENIWIELYPVGTNTSSPNFEPDALYSNLSPTGTLNVIVPTDFTGSVLQISLIVDRYDRVGRANGEILTVTIND